MNRAKRNRIAAAGALHMAHDEGKKAAIAVDDDERAQNMLKVVIKAAKEHGFELGDIHHGKGVITVPVGEGEVRIVAVVKSGPGLN